MASVSAERWGMLQQSVPLPTMMVTHKDIKGPYSNSTGTPQMQMGSNPSVKAATTYRFYPALSTSFAPCLVVCSHVKKLFAVFLLKEGWVSWLREVGLPLKLSELLL